MEESTNPVKSGRTDATILIVDDEPANLGVLNMLLQPHYRVRVARSGAEALRVAATTPRPDLVLLDVMMPEMDGHAVIGHLRANPDTAGIPVIFVTAMDTSENEQHGLELGAVDYITKPISPAIVLARVRAHLELKAARDQLADQNAKLENLVAQRTQALKVALEKAETAHEVMRNSFFGTLKAICALSDLRATSIGGHSRRVANISRQVAQDMGMDTTHAQEVFVAGLLHDIGRIGFSDELLHKQVSAMKADELADYRQHPTLGADVLSKIGPLTEIANIVRYHHERYDGSGFPEGRSGLDIPLGARIIAAVSDFDDFLSGALTTAPMSRKESHRYLVEGRGHRYDPAVIDRLEPILAFEKNDEINEIRVAAAHLQEGMTLTRDVMHPDGFLLLSKNTVLERQLIDQMVTVEREVGSRLEIYVLREPEPAHKAG